MKTTGLLASVCCLGLVRHAPHGAAVHHRVTPDSGAGPVRTSTELPQHRCGRGPRYAWVITRDSVGPIALMNTIEALRVVCPGSRDSVDRSEYYAALVIGGFDGRLRVEPYEARWSEQNPVAGPVGIVTVADSSIRTPEALGVGSSLGEVRRALGSVLIRNDPHHGIDAIPRSANWLALRLSPSLLRRFAWTAADTAAHSDSFPDSALVLLVQVFAPTPSR
jgi:hypothetical protein